MRRRTTKAAPVDELDEATDLALKYDAVRNAGWRQQNYGDADYEFWADIDGQRHTWPIWVTDRGQYRVEDGEDGLIGKDSLGFHLGLQVKGVVKGDRKASRGRCASCGRTLEAGGIDHEFDLTDLSLREAGKWIYDETQTNSDIRDGDLIHVETSRGSALVLLQGAWPVQVGGDVELPEVHQVEDVEEMRDIIEQDYPSVEKYIDWGYVRTS